MLDGRSAWADLGPDSLPGEPAEPKPTVVIVLWTGHDAASIQDAALLLGTEPEALVRWAVARTIAESTFTAADERARSAFDFGPGGRA